jgi:transcription-repair coupling factor (superfamily II helicase)
VTADSRFLDQAGLVTIGGLPDSAQGLALARLARARGPVIYVARDEVRLTQAVESLAFYAPDVAVLSLPAWDCLPYDRVSPNGEVLARRVATLAALSLRKPEGALILATTINAAVQRVPPKSVMAASILKLKRGQIIAMDAIQTFLAANGYGRTGTVREAGDYAIRGGILDLFPSGAAEPVRLDFFGEQLESLRCFDGETQRSTGTLEELTLVPASEALLDPASIKRFRQGYVQTFGLAGDDPLYEAIAAGRRHPGMEHWLPLFHERLETIFDYLPGAPVALDAQADEARNSRAELIADYFDARKNAPVSHDKTSSALSNLPYRALDPHLLYLDQAAWTTAIAGRKIRAFSANDLPQSLSNLDFGGKMGRNFAAERQSEGTNVFEAVGRHVQDLRKTGKKIIIASWSIGARDRLKAVLDDHKIAPLIEVAGFSDVERAGPGAVCLGVLQIETGFETADLAVISEQDILGERMVRQRKRSRRAENFLREASGLSQGDLVVHVDHGIGRYDGLFTLDVNGAPHDCLLLLYAGGDKLYLPVENIDLLTRFGAEDQDMALDRLGGGAWQSRRAKLKNRIRDMAAELMRIAAARQLKHAPVLGAPEGVYDEFCARFPYEETEDQEAAIADVMDDLGKGQPMDRLICGDVGFGKTEVALRAAFVMAMSGRQVAVVVPTTLLCRQHYRTFSQRFAGWPVKVRQLSRLVSAKEAADVKQGLTEGSVDVVIGTHALLSQSINFRDLALVIVDEEQHFGVKHKERLKALKADVHVLTLSATPIPRTLQLAMSGVRELSLIATPPVDRLAVKTFVMPFDPVTLREALLREHYRGGQSFYVVPRIADLDESAAFLRETVPEVKVAIAHGQMPPTALEDVMNAFYERQFDVLLSTTIVESGLDVSNANTMIVHRADMFGLSQLYQLRGRIGRAKTRAFAYLTVPTRRVLTPAADKRLKVLQSLDSLGAGFTLASHDLDIRGAGNLLGEEQSGHIKEVGIELYQSMLEEAIEALRHGGLDDAQNGQGDAGNGKWSPAIALGMSVLIPDSYVTDLDARLGLYRRLGDVESRADIDAFAAELIDRFGPLPAEVEHLLNVVELKGLSRQAGIEKLDAGPKGLIVTFRANRPPNPIGVIDWVRANMTIAKLRHDQKLVLFESDDDPAKRVKIARNLLTNLLTIAAKKAAA